MDKSNLLIVCQNGKYALCDTDGLLLTNFEYDRFGDGLSYYIVAEKNGKQGLLNTKGILIVPCIYDRVKYNTFHNQRMRVQRNGKYGFVDENGEEIIPCIYDYAHDFCDNIDVTSVRSDNLSALINKNGMLITPFKYKECDGFIDGIPLAVTEIDNVFGCIDTKGSEAVPFVYSNMRQFSKGYSCVCINDKWGCIDRKGRIVIPCLYDESFYFRDEGIAVVIKNGEGVVINKNNHVFRDIKGFYKNWEDDYNNYLTYFSEGYGKVFNGKKYGFVNLEGDLVISYAYDAVGAFVNNFAKAQRDGYWGFIDTKGQPITNFKYIEVDDFKYDHAVVKEQRYNEKGEYSLEGVIDKNGKEIIPCLFSSVYLQPHHIVVENKGKYGAFDYSGKQIAQCVYDKLLYPLDDNSIFIKAKYDNKLGLIDATGEIILPYEFEEIFSGGHESFLVRKDSKWGVVDLNNNTMIPIKYNFINFVNSNRYIAEDQNGCYLINRDNQRVTDYQIRGVIDIDKEYLYCKKM